MKAPPAPIVTAALSGFVAGVLITLVTTGTLVHRSASKPQTATPAPVTRLSEREMRRRIERLVSRTLGPQPADPTKSRLIDVKLTPITAPDRALGQSRVYSGFESVLVVFRLNNHPFGKSWRLRAGEADTFAVLKTLYTSLLPVYDVQLTGMFPLDPKNPAKLQPALRAYVAYDAAAKIPWHRWGRDDESRLWKALTSRWVDHRFG